MTNALMLYSGALYTFESGHSKTLIAAYMIGLGSFGQPNRSQFDDEDNPWSPMEEEVEPVNGFDKIPTGQQL